MDCKNINKLLKWLPKLGVDTSPRPHAHRCAWVYESEEDKRITLVPNRVKNHNNVFIFGRNTTKLAISTLCRKSKRSSCSTMRRQRPARRAAKAGVARCKGRRRPDMQFRQSGRINVVEDRRSQAKAFTCTTNVIYVHYLRSTT